MRAYEFGQVLVIIGIGLGSAIAAFGSWEAKVLGMFVAGGAIAWYVAIGRRLNGWIGQSYEELEKELRSLEQVALEWKYSDGSEVPPQKRKGMIDRRISLCSLLENHPNNPKKQNVT